MISMAWPQVMIQDGDSKKSPNKMSLTGMTKNFHFPLVLPCPLKWPCFDFYSKFCGKRNSKDTDLGMMRPGFAS